MKIPELKNLFHFNKRDRNGIVFLLIMLLLVIGFHYYRTYFYKPTEPFLIDNFYFRDSIPKDGSMDYTKPVYIEYAKKSLDLNYFDPNSITHDELINMGLPAFFASNLIRYREKGGRFREINDVKIIYGMDSITFKTIKPFIKIPKADETFQAIEKEVQKDTLLNINVIRWYELMRLGVVDEKLAKRIVNFRNLLGRYFSCKQLYNVHEIDSVQVNHLCRYLFFDTTKIQKMNLNTITYKACIKHPYLTKFEVNAIFSYKKNKKIFSMNELVDNKIIGNNKAELLMHYVEF